MKVKNYFTQAITSIYSLKLRSFLAILGILIGSSSIVALINASHLATATALKQFQNLGTRNLSVVTYNTKNSGESNSIELRQWQSMPLEIRAIEKVAPYISNYQSLSFQGHQVKGMLIGADEALFDVLDIQIQSGTLLVNGVSYEHICVIGDNLKEQIQSVYARSPIGEQIRIGNLLYKIVGVLKPWQENGFFTEDINQAVIIPINSMGLLQKNPKIYHAVLTLRFENNLDDTIIAIKKWILDKTHDVGIFIRSAQQIIDSMREQGSIFTLLLAFIGSIAMLVGGIGIMNIMLISVTERKQEIGVRKAVGATNKDIELLFLIESLFLSLIGGSVGSILGVIVTYVVAYFNHWEFAIYWPAFLIGFSLSVLTGILSGFYPAKKAAKLEPIACLKAS